MGLPQQCQLVLVLPVRGACFQTAELEFPGTSVCTFLGSQVGPQERTYRRARLLGGGTSTDLPFPLRLFELWDANDRSV
ncbi:hypothetical protein BC826DRAFT_1010663, partial [Russula brevipes]